MRYIDTLSGGKVAAIEIETNTFVFKNNSVASIGIGQAVCYVRRDRVRKKDLVDDNDFKMYQ